MKKPWIVLHLQLKPKLWQQYILSRHFFLRYFSGDSLAFSEQRKEKLIVFCAFLGTAGLIISHKLYFGYLISGLTGSTAAQIWREKTVFLTNFMILIGIVSIFTWNAMFPDRRDYQNLLCQPVSIPSLLLAKFLSQLAFVALTTLSVILPASLVISLYVGNIIPQAVPLYLAVQFATFLLAALFVYLCLHAIQGLLLLLPHRLYQKLSLYVQLSLLGALAVLFTAFPRFFPRIASLKEQGVGLGVWFPPLWFVGLGEKLLGSHGEVYSVHWRLALLSLLASLILYRALATISYRKHLQTIPEAAPRRTGSRFSLHRTLADIWLKSPVQKAIYDFTLRSLKKSRQHRFVIGIAALVPLVHVLVVVLYSYQNQSFFQLENSALLSFTVIFIPFIVGGLRYAVSMPAHIEANWIFKIYFPESEKDNQTGLKLALWKSYYYPILLLSFLLYNSAGDLISAFMLTAFDAALLFLVQEWAFLHFQKIPFTCSSTLVTFNIKAYWPLILAGFFTYVSLFTSFKEKLLQDSSFFLYALPGFFLLHLLYRKVRRRFLSYNIPMTFDEDPEPVMLSLDIE